MTHLNLNMTHLNSNMIHSSSNMIHSSSNMTHSSSNMIHSSSISVRLNFDWCIDSMLAKNMTFTMCRDTILLVFLSVFFRIVCSQNFLFLFDHHVNVIIFCDKFEHDYSSVWLNFWLMFVENMIFSLDMMLVVFSNVLFHDNVRKESLVFI